jgi:hypothetical protein
MKFRQLLQIISNHGRMIITLLIISVGVLLVWFLASGFSPSIVQITIGIASISAFFAAISSIANLLQAVETEKQRRNQERPYVNAYFDASNSSFIHFIVENSGNSPAKNIILDINPTPKDYAGRNLNEVSFFSHPISFFPANKKVRQLVDVGYKFLAQDRPVNFEISVRYLSIFGDLYTDNFVQNLEYLRQSTVLGKSIEDNLGEITKEIKDLRELLTRAEHFGALQVETPDQNRQRIELLARDRNDFPWWRRTLIKMLTRLLSKIK